MISGNPYVPQPAELIEVIDETPTIKTLVLKPATPMPFRAGQFVQLTLPGVGEAPFTPSSSPLEPNRIEVTILKTGAVTDRLHECKAGQTLGLRGPFGKGYPIEKLAGKDVLVVGGGVGLAPLRALILALLADLGKIKRMSIKYGARCTEELLFRKQHESWTKGAKVDMAVTIDRPQAGWSGHTGVVTTLLTGMDIDKSNAMVFVCGPTIMLRFVVVTLVGEQFRSDQIYLSMNRRMSCGMGLCGRCNIGPYYLCKDGPDMNYAKIENYPNVF
ncbi:MAG TPA: FAD/NAD(P)-binding protein [Phycisphaerae bacterium]|nr:FAD/NAD(P)-binding protein [Phycisphaerae bacterium]HUT60921.1 FAD/NAD(P)-binding protein [Phycisphaerae bacterium]